MREREREVYFPSDEVSIQLYKQKVTGNFDMYKGSTWSSYFCSCF